jgi:hypothetical protein
MSSDLMPNERYAETEQEEIQAELNEELYNENKKWN